MKEELLLNINKIHTTLLGEKRIDNNLNINNGVSYVKTIMLDENSEVIKKGKNYYVSLNDVIITINSYSYTIITAHRR